jgi:hypothetical protein
MTELNAILPEVDDVEMETSTIDQTTTDNNYHYLLSMPMISLSEEKVQEMIR